LRRAAVDAVLVSGHVLRLPLHVRRHRVILRHGSAFDSPRCRPATVCSAARTRRKKCVHKATRTGQCRNEWAMPGALGYNNVSEVGGASCETSVANGGTRDTPGHLARL